MARYILETTGDPQVLEDLKSICTKVGKPGTIAELVIVESDASEDILRSIEGVLDVEGEEEAEPDESDLSLQTQPSVSNWFLRALAQDAQDYRYPNDASDVDIYILDSGIYYHHPEFEGRVLNLWSFDGEAYGDNIKQSSHGTMCAGCAAGKEYGVAKGARIVNVRYNWRNTEAIKALDVILNHHLEKPNDRGSVLSMSFSTTSRFAYKLAIRKIIDHGIICFASTGNYRESTARFPAGNEGAIGVSCLQRANTADPLSQLIPASYTNYGEGTDLWAPGHEAPVAGYKTEGTMNASGTSAACPVSAGVMAMFLQGSVKLTSRQDVESAFATFLSRCTIPQDLTGRYAEAQVGEARVVVSAFESAIFKAPEPEPVPEPVPEPTPVDPEPPAKKKDKDKPWYKKPAVQIGGGIGLIIVLSLIFGG